MRKILSCSAVLLAAAGISSGCSSEESGTPSAQVPETSEVSSSTDPSLGGYEIPEPLELSPFSSRPCDLVAQDILDELGYDPEGTAKLEESDAVAARGGPYCFWRARESGEGTLTVTILSGNAERGFGGLSGLRSLYEQGEFAYWEDATVLDYPAAYVSQWDRRADGECGISVGVSEEMAFSVMAGFYREDPDRACSVVSEVAEDVVGNLRGEA